MKNVFMVIGIVIGIALISFGSYFVAKHFNYSFMYRDMVRETIREMVKDEALRK